MIYRKFMA